MTTTLMNLA